MYDYKVSIHNHLDSACRAFAQSHNLEQLAKSVGMRPATLRCKLNPDQPHQLTLIELIAITDSTEDPRILDGMLRQLHCQPSVPVNNATMGNMQFCALTAAASVGAIAGEAVSTEQMTQARRNQILDRASDAIRSLSLIVYSVEARFQSAPKRASAWVFTSTGSGAGMVRELLTDIPAVSSIYTAAFMLTGSDLSSIRGMIHDRDHTGA